MNPGRVLHFPVHPFPIPTHPTIDIKYIDINVLVLPLDQMVGPVALPGWFSRFLGVAEVLGALGLVLPGLLRIRPGLTPLAAVGLVIIMIGATVVTLVGGMVAVALMNVVLALLGAFVAYGRWRLAPYRSRPPELRPAR
jgi:hypothetical protein